MAPDIEMANDEGSDPTSDLTKKKSDTAGGSADSGSDTVPEDDPDKVQNLTKAGRADFDPNAGSD